MSPAQSLRRKPPQLIQQLAPWGSDPQPATEQTEIRAAVVLAADGISGTSLANEPWSNWTIDPNAWIGVAATCPPDAFDLPLGEIHMHVGNSGYVGLVRMNEDHIHMAAALDPAACKSAGGPIPLMRKILDSNSSISPLPVLAREATVRGLHEIHPAHDISSLNQSHLFDWESLRIRGTASLTRHRKQRGGHRVLAIGDACGYVEPFTGEGIAWAVAGAREAVRLLPAPGEPWPSDLPMRWQKQHDRLIAGKQRWCRGMRPIMRHPELAPVIMTVANAVPTITRWVATRISQPRHTATAQGAPT
jgi:flavin-dependent dehydrogenase